MRKADAIAAALVLRGVCHILVACMLVLAVQVVQSCTQWDNYMLTGLWLMAGLLALHGAMDRFSAMLLGLWLDLLYGRFLGLGVMLFGIVFQVLEGTAQGQLSPKDSIIRKILFFIAASAALGVLALC